MQIQVRMGEPLWRAAGRRRLSLAWPAGASVMVADVLARLGAEHPAFPAALAGQGLAQPNPYRLFVDSVPAEPSAPLADGQVLFILLPAIGG